MPSILKLIISSLSSQSIELKTLYDEFENAAMSNKGNRSLINHCFFLLRGNTVIAQKKRGIGLRELETYFHWAVKDQIGEDQRVVLEAPIDSKMVYKDDRIKEIVIGDSFLANPTSADPSPEGVLATRMMTLQKKNIIKDILDLFKESGSLEEYIPEDRVKVSVRLQVIGRKWKTVKEEEATLKALELNLRNIPEDVNIKLRSGQELKGHDVRWTRIIQIACTSHGYPDEESLCLEMQKWVKVIEGHA